MRTPVVDIHCRSLATCQGMLALLTDNREIVF